MKSQTFVIVTAVCLTALIAGPVARTQSTAAVQPKPKTPAKTLAPFESDTQLAAFLRKIADEQRQRRRMQVAEMAAAPSPAVAGAAPADSVTNVQHAGVDEGGIVKVHGDHLVVLRRGRLFTIRIDGTAMQPVSAVDAFGPGIDPGGAWYDEMLVSNGTVVVIGYSYHRGGTEIGLFDIDNTGQLRYRSTYHLRSNDYYSSRNYSSRLIGNTLVFYSPLYMNPDVSDVFASLPALRRWRPGATTREFRRIAPAARVYRAAETTPGLNLALHTVTTCDLTRAELACQSTSVMGPAGNVFYVSPRAIYIWTTDRPRLRAAGAPSSMLYRMPLDGSPPAALRTAGSPVDQFSFLESTDGHLNVLVRSMAAGDGMWNAEVTAGEAALFRIATDAFSDGTVAAPASSYRALPTPSGYVFQNRFVGKYLLYGTGSGWGGPTPPNAATGVHAVQWNGDSAFFLPLAHGVDRIEALDTDAVVIGTSGRDLHFTPVRLGDRAALGTSFVRPEASQGELRSHGFFYKPENASTGVLGLPISRAARPGYKHLFENSAAILFLRNQSLAFAEIGELSADTERAVDDRCRASCVDWYGNARPLFLRGRVIALLGYELVEGALASGRMQETQRVSFAPPPR